MLAEMNPICSSRINHPQSLHAIYSIIFQKCIVRHSYSLKLQTKITPHLLMVITYPTLRIILKDIHWQTNTHTHHHKTHSASQKFVRYAYYLVAQNP